MLQETKVVIWSLWRSSGPAMAVVWLISALSIASWLYADSKAWTYLDDGLYTFYACLLWLTGFAILFTENSSHGLKFAFPVQRFTLPLSTMKLAGTVVSYRVFLALVHTAICLLPIYIGDFSRPEYLGLAPLLLIVAGCAIALQWAAFLQVRQDAFRALGTVVGASAGFLMVAWLVVAYIANAEWRTACILASVDTLILIFCLRAARFARFGGVEHRCVTPDAEFSSSPSKFNLRNLLYLFPSWPLWSQVWLEFRSTCIWLPAILLIATFAIVVPTALTSTVQLEFWDLQSIGTTGLAIAFATGYMWERGSRTTTRFCMALPQSEPALATARGLAGLIAVILSLLGISTILGVALAIRTISGDPLMARNEAVAFAVSLAVATLPTWWIVLICGRFLFIAAIPATIAFSLLSALFWDVTSEDVMIAILLIMLSSTLLALGLGVRRRYGVSTPWTAAIIPILALSALLMKPDAAAMTLKYLVPTAFALAVVLYARRSGLLNGRAPVYLVVLFFLAFTLQAWLLPLLPYNAGIVDASSAGYVAAGLVLPFVWIPLLARIQRSG